MVTKRRLLIIFAGTILGMIILDYILFVGIFSQIPQKYIGWLFKDLLFSIILFVWVFLILPVLVAYVLVIRPISKTMTDEQRKIILAAIGILGFITILFWRLLGQSAHFVPYSLESISEATEFGFDQTIVPEGVIATRFIGGKRYYLKISDQNAQAVNLYTTDGGSAERIIWPSVPVSPERTIDFWYDEDGFTLFTVEGKGSTVGGDAYEQIFAYTQTKPQIKSLWIGMPGLYSGIRILTYYPENKTLVFSTSGGDGCGGWGKVWTLGYSGVEKTVQKFAAGCGDLKLPRFMGVLDKTLVFAKFEETDDFAKSHMTRLYTHNPLTGQKANILEKSDLPKDITVENFHGVVKQEGDKWFVFINDSGEVSVPEKRIKEYKIDPTQHKIVGEVPKQAGE